MESYLRETRLLAVAALLALLAGILSDALGRDFWTRHPLVANLTASLIVVILSVALVNEAVERRRRRRWRVLAQYVMLELVRHARMVWTGVIELTGLLPSDALTAASIDAGGRAVRDRSRLTEAIRNVVADIDRRQLLHAGLNRSVTFSNEVLGRWTDVMLNTDAYAQLVDRHVALASDVAWLGSILDQFEPIEKDCSRRRITRSSPAIQVQGALDDSQLTNRVVSITQLAEELDRGTLDLALRIVPVDWWQAHHGWTAPLGSVGQAAPR